jgi:YhcG PDDEXK nuclease domain
LLHDDLPCIRQQQLAEGYRGRDLHQLRLHSYFVIELKIGAFKPEYAGKLNFYLSAVDGIMRSERDDPTIGLLLCESRKGAVVEYAFKDIHKPIGVATYRVTRELPEPLKAEVPSIEDLEGVVEKLRPEFDEFRAAQLRSEEES